MHNNSTHTFEVDVELDKDVRLITVTAKSTATGSALSNIAYPAIRRKEIAGIVPKCHGNERGATEPSLINRDQENRLFHQLIFSM